MPISKRRTDSAKRGDLDDRPLTAADLKRMKRVPRVKLVRRALGLTQEEFAERYRIPLGTLRDWEQGRSAPDGPAKAYLSVIAAEPAIIADVVSATEISTKSGREQKKNIIRGHSVQTRIQKVSAMSKGRDRTVYRASDGNWANKRNDADRASSVHRTQGDAERAARDNLRNQGGGELTTKGRDGVIRSKDTIAPGRDPYPPRDREH